MGLLLAQELQDEADDNARTADNQKRPYEEYMEERVQLVELIVPPRSPNYDKKHNESLDGGKVGGGGVDATDCLELGES